jgi:hypothetical protein
MAEKPLLNEKSGASGHRRRARYLRASGEKSSKSGTFRTGKIIPSSFRAGCGTTGTAQACPPFHQQTKHGSLVMYIGLGGLLVLILILWLLGVI